MSKTVNIKFTDSLTNESFVKDIIVDELKKIEYLYNSYVHKNCEDNIEIILDRKNAVFNKTTFEHIYLYSTTKHIIVFENKDDFINFIIYLEYFTIMNVDQKRLKVLNAKEEYMKFYELILELLKISEFNVFKYLVANNLEKSKTGNNRFVKEVELFIIDNQIVELYEFVFQYYIYVPKYNQFVNLNPKTKQECILMNINNGVFKQGNFSSKSISFTNKRKSPIRCRTPLIRPPVAKRTTNFVPVTDSDDDSLSSECCSYLSDS